MQFLQGLLGGGQMSLMGLIVFVLVTWFSGTYIKAIQPYRPHIIVAGAVLFFIVLVIQKMVAKKSAAAIEDRLRAQAQEQVETARPDRKPQVEALQKQLTEAIAALKTSKMGGNALYSLPWYIIIGPPGSGKSTALQESGLNFPYMSQGRKGIRGVGGTRNCDWWFTDQGILLDTAGRYTTELEDRDEWLSFLDMLKKCRKRKPINGAIVCVSVADLVQCSDEERDGHVKNIRDRIDELTKRLEQVFPIYLVFTKCDLLNGFVDFFEDFGKSDRAQVWGFTLPYGGARVESYAAVFDEEIRRLYTQLSAQRIAVLAAERPADKKRRIFGFPIQFSLAHRKLADFVGELFRPNPFTESSVLRGVYFTSGTQEGTPIDQLVAAMGGAFGLQEDAAGLLSQAVDRKSYFINALFSKVIFGDQNLARSSTRVARRRQILRAGMVAASLLALVGFSISLGIAFIGNLRLMSSVGATAKKLQDAGKSSPQDLAGNLQALEDLRLRIAELSGYTTEKLPMSLRWGLYRGGEVYVGEDKKSGIRRVYVNAINTMFLKNLGQTLGGEMTQLRENRNKTDREFDQLFDLLQVYQMVGGKIPPKRELVDAVLRDQDRWIKALGPTAASLPDESKKIASAQRDFYIAQLVLGMEWKEIELPRTEVEPKLIADVIEDLKGGLWVTESFRNLITQAGVRYKPVSVETLLGKLPGKDLFDSPAEFHVPGAYTQTAYSEYIRSAIKEKSQNLSDKLKLLNVEKAPDAIGKDLLEKYTTEYSVRWSQFLKNIDLRKFDNLKDAETKLKVLTAQNSPYREIIKGIWEGRALQLSERPDDVINKSTDDRKWVDEAIKALEELQRGLAKMLNLTTPGDRFVSMDERALKELSYSLDSCKGKVEGATKMADLALAESAARVFNRSLTSTLEAFVSEAQGEAENLWKSTVVDVYAKKLAGKYPLAAAATEEIPMRTFSEVFNPKSGTFWKTVGRLQRLRDGFKFEDRSLVRFSTDFDECVRKAEQFRDALYASKDAEQIEQTLTLTLGPRVGVVEITVYIGDKKFSSLDDPDRRGTLIWSEAAPRGAKVDIRHDDNQRTAIEKYAGQDWGLLRLFLEVEGGLAAKGEKAYACSWVFNVTVSGGPVKRYADCTLEVKDKVTPFAPKFFTDFKCPERMGP